MVDKNEIIKKLSSGDMKLHEIEKFTSNLKESVDIRREFIESVSAGFLDNVAHYSLDMDEAVKKNIENPVGTIQIPVGVAGPLKVKGEYAQGDFYVPLATSEGALVASVNRGCSLITQAGGVTTRIISDKMTRAPVIKAESVIKALEIKTWIEDNFQKLKETAETTTSHGKLLKIDPILVVGSYLYPRFV